MSQPRDDFSAIPILLNPVPEAEGVRELRELTTGLRRAAAPVSVPALAPAPAAAVAPQAARPLPGREAQQSLFDDLPVVPPRQPRRGKLPPTLQRMAEDLLRTRAPAIINELADEHARRLSTELRERLRKELARLLAELADADPLGQSMDAERSMASGEASAPAAPAVDGVDTDSGR